MLPPKSLRTILCVAAIPLCTAQSAFAANGTWTGGGANSNFSNTANWLNGLVPSSGATATFNTTPTIVGNGTTTPVNIDTTSVLLTTITFDSGAAAYTLGSTTGNAIGLNGSTPGIVLTGSVTANQTINAPLTSGGGSGEAPFFENLSSTYSLTVNGSFTYTGTGTNTSGSLYLGGTNTTASNGAATNYVTGTLTQSQTGTKNLSIRQNGAGIWVLSGTNTYAGTTFVAGNGTSGTLQFAKEVSLYNDTTASWTAANITTNTAATLAFNVGGTGEFTTSDIATLLSQVGGSSTSTVGFTGNSSIGFDTTNAAGGVFTYGGAIANYHTETGLVKLGANTLILSGANTYGVNSASYTGTAVNGGTLLITGTSTGGGLYTVNNGGKIGGAGGTITLGSTAGGMTINTGGGLSPSGGGTVTPGTMTLNGSGALTLTPTLNQTGMLTFVLGTASDRVNLTGTTTLAIGNGVMALGDYTFVAGTGFGAGTYTLFDTNTATGINGSLSANTTGSFNGYNITLSETTVGGHEDLILTVAAVPEPSGLAASLVFAGVCGLGHWRRMFRRRASRS